MSAEQPTPAQPLLTVVSSDVTPEGMGALAGVFESPAAFLLAGVPGCSPIIGYVRL